MQESSYQYEQVTLIVKFAKSPLREVLAAKPLHCFSSIKSNTNRADCWRV